jgi:dihydrolipoamide dehydrogenase
MGVIVDRSRRVLVGAWAVAFAGQRMDPPGVSRHRADIPVDVLLDQVPQYPTYSEAYLAALERLN